MRAFRGAPRREATSITSISCAYLNSDPGIRDTPLKRRRRLCPCPGHEEKKHDLEISAIPQLISVRTLLWKSHSYLRNVGVLTLMIFNVTTTIACLLTTISWPTT